MPEESKTVTVPIAGLDPDLFQKFITLCLSKGQMIGKRLNKLMAKDLKKEEEKINA